MFVFWPLEDNQSFEDQKMILLASLEVKPVPWTGGNAMVPDADMEGISLKAGE